MFENNFMTHVATIYFRDHASSFPQEIHFFKKRTSIQITFMSHPVNITDIIENVIYLFS